MLAVACGSCDPKDLEIWFMYQAPILTFCQVEVGFYSKIVVLFSSVYKQLLWLELLYCSNFAHCIAKVCAMFIETQQSKILKEYII